MSVILIIADREGEAQVALPRGLGLAAKMGYAVQVVAFCYEALAKLAIGDRSKQAEIRKQMIERRKAEVEAQINKHKPADLRVTCLIIWQKDIHHWIDRQCARKSYAVVIKTGKRSESFLYTSTDWHLLRECPAPVLIAAEKKWRPGKPIVAAIDLASKLRVKQRLNNEVIATAKHYADAFDCPLYLIHVLHIPSVLRELDLVDEYTYAKELRKDLQPRLLKLSKAHGIPESQFRLKEGPVDKVISSEAARLKAQLLVMGTVGRKGIRAKLMGNTAERVLTRLRTDVLAIKP